MSERCIWLHKQLGDLSPIRFPFRLDQLPRNGIYFFYEEGEICGHEGDHPRIVRIGTHRDGNFRSRIREHFLLDETRMNFDATKPAPHDRSIFRKNLGRALLNKANDEYLRIWASPRYSKRATNRIQYHTATKREIFIQVHYNRKTNEQDRSWGT